MSSRLRKINPQTPHSSIHSLTAYCGVDVFVPWRCLGKLIDLWAAVSLSSSLLFIDWGKMYFCALINMLMEDWFEWRADWFNSKYRPHRRFCWLSSSYWNYLWLMESPSCCVIRRRLVFAKFSMFVYKKMHEKRKIWRSSSFQLRLCWAFVYKRTELQLKIHKFYI